MPSPVVYLAATGHGFGHAVRIASVAAQIKHLRPDIGLILVTAAPRWLLEAYIADDFIYRPRSFDVGVVQSDSFAIDKQATLAKMQRFRERQAEIVCTEVDFIQTNRVGLILADIPPLAAPIAQAAGIPGWMMTNFGWDFIYRDWGSKFTELAEWIGECYSQSTLLFRLPMAEPLTVFPQRVEMGLTGGNPRYPLGKLREHFNLTAPKEKTILLTFGGLGLQQIPYKVLENYPGWQFISFDRQAPPLPNLVKIQDPHYRPVDFMPLCDRVVSKPGFSTFAEALRLSVPIVSLTREGFAESPLLLQGIQDYARHLIIDPQDFFSDRWDFIVRPCLPPRLDASLPTDGSERIAQAVIDYFS
ncbi:MAG: UDP-N-acetylglucosamine--N-acetylmuramyl-(pentapeptide) pyrophosphoryl-undecaprenol N-acetylglucosamine transferase [Chloroflexaceae bacterium]|nr:UDP-N-acetylglucosamine--N-acetylmuramyl-(pentapeptide) pyrophosphoryl-undecaprenol N-acetylglucosamine transferase [Chloroflexaceae bacterium]